MPVRTVIEHGAMDRRRSPAQLVGDYDASYERLVTIIETIGDEMLTDPDALPGPGIAIVDVDLTGHLHDEHVSSVRAWLGYRVPK